MQETVTLLRRVRRTHPEPYRDLGDLRFAAAWAIAEKLITVHYRDGDTFFTLTEQGKNWLRFYS